MGRPLSCDNRARGRGESSAGLRIGRLCGSTQSGSPLLYLQLIRPREAASEGTMADEEVVNIDDMPTTPMGGDEGAEETKADAPPKQVEFDPSQVPLAGAEDADMPPAPPMLRERSDSMASDASEPEYPYDPEDNISAPGTLVRAPKLVAYGKSKTIEAFVGTMDVFLDGAGKPRDYWERKKGMLFTALLDMVYCNKMQDALTLLQMMDPANTRTFDSRSPEELENIKDERFREMSIDLEAMIAVEEDAKKKKTEEAGLEYVAPEPVATPVGQGRNTDPRATLQPRNLVITCAAT